MKPLFILILLAASMAAAATSYNIKTETIAKPLLVETDITKSNANLFLKHTGNKVPDERSLNVFVHTANKYALRYKFSSPDSNHKHIFALKVSENSVSFLAKHPEVNSTLLKELLNQPACYLLCALPKLRELIINSGPIDKNSELLNILENEVPVKTIAFFYLLKSIEDMDAIMAAQIFTLLYSNLGLENSEYEKINKQLIELTLNFLENDELLEDYKDELALQINQLTNQLSIDEDLTPIVVLKFKQKLLMIYDYYQYQPESFVSLNITYVRESQNLQEIIDIWYFSKHLLGFGRYKELPYGFTELHKVYLTQTVKLLTEHERPPFDNLHYLSGMSEGQYADTERLAEHLISLYFSTSDERIRDVFRDALLVSHHEHLSIEQISNLLGEKYAIELFKIPSSAFQSILDGIEAIEQNSDLPSLFDKIEQLKLAEKKAYANRYTRLMWKKAKLLTEAGINDISIYRELTLINEDPFYLAEAGYLLIAGGNFLLASEIVEELQSTFPDSVDLVHLQTKLLSEDGQVDKAITLAKEYLAKNHYNKDLEHNLASFYMINNEFSVAKALYLTQINDFGNVSTQLNRNMAIIALFNNDYSEAQYYLNEMKKHIATDSERNIYWLWLAALNTLQGNPVNTQNLPITLNLNHPSERFSIKMLTNLGVTNSSISDLKNKYIIVNKIDWYSQL